MKNEPLEERRAQWVYTFDGGNYDRDMEESPGLREHFPKEIKQEDERNSVLRTEYHQKLQKELHEMFSKK